VATFTWNTGSGSFNTGTNWTPAGPPGTADTANFVTTGGAISGTGAVATLNFRPGTSWSISGQIQGGTINVNDPLSISSGGVLTLTGPSSFIDVAGGQNATGSLTINAGGTVRSTEAAQTANFALLVGGGSSSAGANGTVTVQGAGALLDMGSNPATVGEVGTGTLNVLAGATARFASSNSAVISALSVARSGTGTVTVSGAGSTLTASGFVYVGRAGTGTLTVDQGGTFTGGAAASGSTPSFGIAIGDGSPALDVNGNPNSPLYFGGTGSANVTNGSTLHSLGSLRVGYRGSTGNLLVDTSSTARADGEVFFGSGTDRPGGTGTATIQGGGTVRSGGTHTTGSAGIALGNDVGTTGTVTVSGSGSTLDANGDRLTVGGNGSGTLTISGGAKALAGANYSDVEAAFAVAGAVGATGAVMITGAGSQLIASGDAVIGGNEKGSGPTAGGAGTVNVASGGLLQTGAMTIEAGSSLTVDQSSTLTAPSIMLNGGTANLFTLTNSTAVSFGAGGTLSVHALAGANTVSNFTFGDKIDFAGTTAVALSNDTISTSTGSIAIGAAPANASYQLFADGSGGTFVALTPQTIGVFRFFDKNFGTHFYTSDPNEEQVILKTRPDLVPEGPGGVGLQAISTVSNDPNAAPVYRFFDTLHGTHFFTASASERDTVINTRPDLTFEPTSLFFEHTQPQPGDTPVYRFFDNKFGTHFYTDDPTERATILNTRPDLVAEGIGFYEPAKNSASA
jgi:fibronectin-binding autotransporter adhesin